MPDISMCKGLDCPNKTNCYRFMAEAEPLGQSFFSDPPFTLKFEDDNEYPIFKCDYYWPLNKNKDESN